MSLSDSYIHTLVSKHKEDFEQFTIDKVNESTWYVGFNLNFNALKSEASWIIYKLANTGTTVDVAPCGSKADCIWDNRESLSYLPFSNLQFIGDTELLPMAIINDEIGTFSYSGGNGTITYSIISDPLDKFKIVDGALQYKNTVVVGQIPTLTVRLTDSHGTVLEKTFNFTVATYVSTHSLLYTKASDKSSVVDNGDHDISDNMTIVSRFKLTELPSVDNESSCFISKASFGAGDKSFYAWVDKNGDKIHFMQSADGSAIGSCYTLGSMSKDVWYTVVLTFTSGIANIFVNTVKDTGSEATVASLFNSSYPLYIGSLAGSYYRFNGLINDTAVYDKVLSQEEVDYIGTSSIDLLHESAPSNLVSWHSLGNDIYDSGGGAYKVPDKVIGGAEASLISLDLTNKIADTPT